MIIRGVPLPSIVFILPVGTLDILFGGGGGVGCGDRVSCVCVLFIVVLVLVGGSIFSVFRILVCVFLVFHTVSGDV